MSLDRISLSENRGNEPLLEGLKYFRTIFTAFFLTVAQLPGCIAHNPATPPESAEMAALKRNVERDTDVIMMCSALNGLSSGGKKLPEDLDKLRNMCSEKDRLEMKIKELQ